MNSKERFDRFLDKVINALYWETTAELHMQRIMKVHGHHQIKIAENHYKKDITGVITTIEPTKIKPIAIEDAEQTTKMTTLV